MRLELSICVTLFALTSVTFADEADALLELVRDDAAVCLEISQFTEQMNSFRRSATFARLEQSSLGQRWLAGEPFQKLLRLRAAIERFTSTPLPVLVDQLFGRAVVLAIYLPEGGEPAGVLLTHLSEPAAADRVLSALQRIEPQRQTTTLQHAGQTYFRQTRPATEVRPEETLYFALFDEVLALTDKEPVLHSVLDLRNRSERETGSLLHSTRFQRARQSIAPSALARLYVNPRAWDRTWKSANKDTSPLLLDFWQRCHSIAAGLHLQEGIALELLVHVDRPNDETSLASDSLPFLERIPRQAVVVAASRVSPAEFGRVLTGLISEKDRPDFDTFRRVLAGLLSGRDLFDDVLPMFGADWGGYVALRSPNDHQRGWLDGVVAFGLRSPSEPSEGVLRASLENGLRFAWNLWATMHNSRRHEGLTVVRSDAVAHADLWWLDGLAGVEPTFALTPDQLLFATSPAALERELIDEKGPRLVDDPNFSHWRSTWFPGEDQLLLLNVPPLRTFLNQHQAAVTQRITRNSTVTSERARERIGLLGEGLELVDAVFVAGGWHETHLRLVLGAVTATEPSDSAQPQKVLPSDF